MADNPLEQFVLLAKTAKGAAAVELVKQALEVGNNGNVADDKLFSCSFLLSKKKYFVNSISKPKHKCLGQC